MDSIAHVESILGQRQPAVLIITSGSRKWTSRRLSRMVSRAVGISTRLAAGVALGGAIAAWGWTNGIQVLEPTLFNMPAVDVASVQTASSWGGVLRAAGHDAAGQWVESSRLLQQHAKATHDVVSADWALRASAQSANPQVQADAWRTFQASAGAKDVILPTVDSVGAMAERLSIALSGVRWERLSKALSSQDRGLALYVASAYQTPTAPLLETLGGDGDKAWAQLQADFQQWKIARPSGEALTGLAQSVEVDKSIAQEEYFAEHVRWPWDEARAWEGEHRVSHGLAAGNFVDAAYSSGFTARQAHLLWDLREMLGDGHHEVRLPEMDWTQAEQADYAVRARLQRVLDSVHSPSDLEQARQAVVSTLRLETQEPMWPAVNAPAHKVLLSKLLSPVDSLDPLPSEQEGAYWEMVEALASPRVFSSEAAPSGLSHAQAQAFLVEAMRATGIPEVRWPWHVPDSPEMLWRLGRSLQKGQADLQSSTGWSGPVLGLNRRASLDLTDIDGNEYGLQYRNDRGDGQPAMAVITSMPGLDNLGPLAHEWFHALDGWQGTSNSQASLMGVNVLYASSRTIIRKEGALWPALSVPVAEKVQVVMDALRASGDIQHDWSALSSGLRHAKSDEDVAESFVGRWVQSLPEARSFILTQALQARQGTWTPSGFWTQASQSNVSNRVGRETLNAMSAELRALSPALDSSKEGLYRWMGERRAQSSSQWVVSMFVEDALHSKGQMSNAYVSNWTEMLARAFEKQVSLASPTSAIAFNEAMMGGEGNRMYPSPSEVQVQAPIFKAFFQSRQAWWDGFSTQEHVSVSVSGWRSDRTQAPVSRKALAR